MQLAQQPVGRRPWVDQQSAEARCYTTARAKSLSACAAIACRLAHGGGASCWLGIHCASSFLNLASAESPRWHRSGDSWYFMAVREKRFGSILSFWRPMDDHL
eukprot:5431763-Karenia_brevis.AAC.1